MLERAPHKADIAIDMAQRTVLPDQDRFEIIGAHAERHAAIGDAAKIKPGIDLSFDLDAIAGAFRLKRTGSISEKYVWSFNPGYKSPRQQ